MDSFTHRTATEADIPTIVSIMKAATTVNMRAFLSEREVEAAQEHMGMDMSLIRDGTYFVVETNGVAVGCGGWGKRRTLYGKPEKDDGLADPETDAARIRHMYTHPEWTRRGIGTLMLALGEDATRAAGFKTIELGATVPGYPLYKSRGYSEFDRHEHIAENGTKSTAILMHKTLLLDANAETTESK